MTEDSAHSTTDIAIVVSDLGSGGAQRVIHRLVTYWSKQQRRIAVITLDSGMVDFFALPDGTRRIALGALGASRSPVHAVLANIHRIFKLRRALADIRAPVTISFIASTNILTILASHFLPGRLVISERNDPSRQSFGTVWDTLRRLLYRQADIVTANSISALEAMRAYVPQKKLRLAENPLPPVVTADDGDLREQIIICVARLHPQKAHNRLLEAFAGLADQFPQWRLSLLGNGPLEQDLRAQAAALAIADKVDFLGTVPDPSPHYRRAAIFALPSLHEGTPNALLEAMAHGLPSVVSNTAGGALEWVDDGTTGLVASPGGPASFAAALEQLMGDESLRGRLGAAARRRVAMEAERSAAFQQWDAVVAKGNVP